MKYFFLVIIIIGLSSCNNVPKREVALIGDIDENILLPIDKGPPPNLRKFELDIPRDVGGVRTVKSTTKCFERAGGVIRDKSNPLLLRPKKDMSNNILFWEQCGEWVPLGNTNILFGFTQEEWEKVVLNLNEMREYILRLEARIDAENARREKILKGIEAKGSVDINE